jgi:nifR3 family TIM-barrel protein
MRLGWDAKNIVAVDVAQAAEAAGIAAVTVHARTKAQGFSGNADWGMIEVVKKSVGIPVIGNGDVRSGQDAKRMMDETGCDGVMIARAIQGYPWIFREARQYLQNGIESAHPTPEERQTIMIRHLNDMVKLLGEAVGVREMRKHLCWYTKGLHGGAEFRTTINHLATVHEVRKEITVFFGSMLRSTAAFHQASCS